MSSGVFLRRVLLFFSVVFAAPFVYALFNLQRIASGPTMFLLFAVLPLLSVLTATIALRARASTRAKFAIVLVLCPACLLLAEVLLVIAGRMTSETDIEALTEESVDGRHMYQVVLDTRNTRVNTVPAVEPQGFLWSHTGGTVRSPLADNGDELLPLGGVANRNTVLCNESGQWITHQSDRYGMNNPDSVWDRTPIQTAAVGDACANGWCCDSEDHFVSLIRQDFPETVNLGISGNGPLLILAGILEYLPELRPKRVLWFHYEKNDFYELERERKSPLLMRYLETESTQNLRDRQGAIDLALEAHVESTIQAWRAASFGLNECKQFAKLGRVRRCLGLRYDSPPNYELLERILTKAKTTIESWGGKLYLVYLPTSDRYRSGFVWSGTFESVQQRVRIDAERLGIDFIDVPQAFLDQGDPLSLFVRIRGGDRIGQYGHYTSEGNKLAATTVLNHVSSSANH